MLNNSEIYCSLSGTGFIGHFIQNRGSGISSQTTTLPSNIYGDKALIEKIAELEEKLSGKEKFDREISRYILHKLKSGMLVYMVKPEHEEMGEPHYICTQCANNGKTGLFQPVLNGTRLVCDSCKKNVMTGWKPGIHKAS